MSFPSPNELEASEREVVKAEGAARQQVALGAGAEADKPDMARPQPRRIRYAFAGDVEMPQAQSEMYTAWVSWRGSAVATSRAVVIDDQAAKMAGVDMAVQWAAPSWEAHEALVALALYEAHAQCRLDVVGGEWKRLAPAPKVGAVPRAQPAKEPHQAPADQVHAEIAAVEARLSELRGPSSPKLSLGELQKVASSPLPYAWQK